MIGRRQRRPEPGAKDFNEAIYHRPPVGMSFFKTGVLFLILVLALSYLAYTKELPWAGDGYQVTATFENATTLRETNPVRIAGVNVGEVTSVEPAGDAAKVTFTVDEEGLPLHTDTQITIRPRLFLEGNFFLDVRPGSPSAPDLPSGGEIPVTQTATAVQLDEILTALQQPDRENLAKLLDGYGSALADEPTAAQDSDQDPDVQGESAAQAINDSFVYGGRAGRSSAQVAQAFLGNESGDLRRLVAASADVFEQLGSREAELSELITNFSITAGAFADESEALEETLVELAPTVGRARTQLVDINEAFPPLRAFARELTPSVRELPATIRAGTPWLTQADRLLRPSELGGIARELRAATPALASGTNSLAGLFRELRLTSRCVSGVLVPAGDIVIDDEFRTGMPNYQEFFYGAASQAGEGAQFDGNGQFLRVQPGGGPTAVSTPVPGGGPSDDELFGNTIMAPTGGQPMPPEDRPPIRTDVACHGNEVPDLNGPAATVGAPSPTPTGP